jgi:NAD(P)-dependent dehydrogenase (short-subunit alcohol dehydrogenase family)
MAAELLISQGHRVVLHARNIARARETRISSMGAEQILLGDLSSLNETRLLASQANGTGKFDAIIFNAAVGDHEQKRLTAEGLSHVFAINSLAPYILTCLMEKPARMIYMSSGLNRSGTVNFDDVNWENRRWNGYAAYSDSKLHNVLLAFAVARKWKNVFSNAVDPGWVPTKMGGQGAPDSLIQGSVTQSWLAVSEEKEALVSGKFFNHKKTTHYNPLADDEKNQEHFLATCEEICGISFPEEQSRLSSYLK